MNINKNLEKHQHKTLFSNITLSMNLLFGPSTKCHLPILKWPYFTQLKNPLGNI